MIVRPKQLAIPMDMSTQCWCLAITPASAAKAPAKLKGTLKPKLVKKFERTKRANAPSRSIFKSNASCRSATNDFSGWTTPDDNWTASLMVVTCRPHSPASALEKGILRSPPRSVASGRIRLITVSSLMDIGSTDRHRRVSASMPLRITVAGARASSSRLISSDGISLREIVNS